MSQTVCIILKPLRSHLRSSTSSGQVHFVSGGTSDLNQAMTGTDEKGMVKLFFELIGQPRHIKGPDRVHAGAGGAVPRKTEARNAAHGGALMPGVISRVFVSPGQTIKAGDVLASVEAMKMEPPSMQKQPTPLANCS